ncbi:oligosaccharide flippase family protein [Enterococcus sp. LJL51]|uniref:oligosaccharide flippase family protein n=1 Tax=Enterococcus sp. LJL51 TaxID=3416656 RepID=UPI003CFB2416
MKKMLTNIVMNALYQALIILIPIITIPYVARVLGASTLGKNTSITSMSLFLGYIVLMGLAQLGPKEISQAEEEKRYEVFKKLWHIQLMMGILVTSLFTCITFFSEDRILWWTQIPYLASVILDISWLFIGLEQVKKVVIRNTSVKLLSLVLIFILVRQENDLWLYLLINSLSVAFANLLFWIDVNHNFPKHTQKNKIAIKASKIYIGSALILLLPQLAVQIYTSFDKVLVGFMVTSAELSYYDQSQKIARIVLAIITSISVVLMPMVAKLDKEKGNTEKVQNLLKYSLDYTLIGALLFTALITLNADIFVPWFLGKEFIPMIQHMKWVSFIIIPVAYGGVFANQFTLAKGLYKSYSIPFIIGALTNITLNLLLTSLMGSFGATMALIITECMVCFLRIFLIRKQMEFKIFFKGQLQIVICFLLTCGLFSHFRINLSNALPTLIINAILQSLFFVFLLLIITNRVKTDLAKIFSLKKKNKSQKKEGS